MEWFRLMALKTWSQAQKWQHHPVPGRDANKLPRPTPDLWIRHSGVGVGGSAFCLTTLQVMLTQFENHKFRLSNQAWAWNPIPPFTDGANLAGLLTLSELLCLPKQNWNVMPLFRDVLRIKWSYILWTKTHSAYHRKNARNNYSYHTHRRPLVPWDKFDGQHGKSPSSWSDLCSVQIRP